MHSSEKILINVFIFFLFMMGALSLLNLNVPLSLPSEGDAIDYRAILSREGIFWNFREDTYNSALPQLWDALRALFTKVSSLATRLPNILLFFVFTHILFRYVKERLDFSRPWAVMATWLCLLVPVVYRQTSLVMSDLPGCVGLVWAAWAMLDEKSWTWQRALRVGLALQLALSTHWSYWGMVAALLLLSVFFHYKIWLKQPRFFAIILLTAFVPYPLWLLWRNFHISENPFFPILASIFPSPYFSFMRAAEFARTFPPLVVTHDPLHFLLLPYYHFFKARFFDYSDGGFLLIAAPLLFGKLREHKVLQRFRVVIFAWAFVWFVSLQNGRFSGPFLILLVLYSVKRIEILWPKIAFKKPLVFAVSLYLMIFSYMAIGAQSFGIAYLKDREGWIDRNIPRPSLTHLLQKEGSGTVGIVDRSGDAAFLPQNIIYMPGGIYSNASLKDHLVCAWVEKFSINYLYAPTTFFDRQEDKESCLDNFKELGNERDWSVRKRKTH